MPVQPSYRESVLVTQSLCHPCRPRRGTRLPAGNTASGGGGLAFTGSTPVVGDITVYAQWTIDQYTVTFDKNGGDTEASPTSRLADYNTTATLPSAPTKTGNSFAGWNTEALGGGDAFNASTPVTADITVYAQWTTNPTFTVTFDKNGGDTDASPTTISDIASGDAVGTLPAAPTKTGYAL